MSNNVNRSQFPALCLRETLDRLAVVALTPEIAAHWEAWLPNPVTLDSLNTPLLHASQTHLMKWDHAIQLLKQSGIMVEEIRRSIWYRELRATWRIGSAHFQRKFSAKDPQHLIWAAITAPLILCAQPSLQQTMQSTWSSIRPMPPLAHLSPESRN